MTPNRPRRLIVGLSFTSVVAGPIRSSLGGAVARFNRVPVGCAIAWVKRRSSSRWLELDALGEGTVDDEVGAGDEAGSWAGDEGDGVGHLLWRAHAPGGVESERCGEQLGVAGLDLGPDASGEVGVARRDRVGPDPLAGQVVGETLGVVDERGLERAVRARREVDLAARDAGDGDDGTPPRSSPGSASPRPRDAPRPSCRSGTRSSSSPRRYRWPGPTRWRRRCRARRARRPRRRTHPCSAGPSPTSRARPVARTPFACSALDGADDVVGVTGADGHVRPLVGQRVGDGASDALCVAPVTMAFRPCSPRSMVSFLRGRSCGWLRRRCTSGRRSCPTGPGRTG